MQGENKNNSTDYTHLTFRIVVCLSELNDYRCAVFWKTNITAWRLLQTA
jgi:hypothetical protein